MSLNAAPTKTTEVSLLPEKEFYTGIDREGVWLGLKFKVSGSGSLFLLFIIIRHSALKALIPWTLQVK